MSVDAYHYVLTLKNEKRKLYNRIGFFVLLGLTLAICFRNYVVNDYQFRLNVFYLPIAHLIFLFLFIACGINQTAETLVERCHTVRDD